MKTFTIYARLKKTVKANNKAKAYLKFWDWIADRTENPHPIVIMENFSLSIKEDKKDK